MNGLALLVASLATFAVAFFAFSRTSWQYVRFAGIYGVLSVVMMHATLNMTWTDNNLFTGAWLSTAIVITVILSIHVVLKVIICLDLNELAPQPMVEWRLIGLGIAGAILGITLSAIAVGLT